MDDVVAFLAELELGEYMPQIRADKIDGSTLLECSKEDLVELGLRGVHASREGGCAAQGGPCAAVRLCVWAWRGGCREAKNACHTRAVAAVEEASPRARGNPLCV